MVGKQGSARVSGTVVRRISVGSEVHSDLECYKINQANRLR